MRDFWEKNDAKIKINRSKLLKFLEINGFASVKENNEIILVRIENNLIEEVSERDIAKFIINYLEGKKEFSVKETYIVGVHMYSSKKFLSLLSSKEIKGLKDKVGIATFYFLNQYVEVTKKSITCKDYSKLDYPIWKKSLIQRDFNFGEFEKSQFERFLSNICGNDTNRIESLRSIIGYLLHNYQNSSFAKAVILTDSEVSKNGKSNGGTGKSLLCRGISYFRNTLEIDGKRIKPNGDFFFQGVDRTTQIIRFDDVKSDFNFEMMYSSITSGITVNKKFKQAFTLRFEDSPKILISSNYAVIGTGGNSDFRRRIEFELSDYYKSRSPLKEFGNNLFDEWDEADWDSFNLYMLNCIKLYLSNGVIFPKSINGIKAKISQLTSPEMYQYFTEETDKNVFIEKSNYLEEYNVRYNQDISSNLLTRWTKTCTDYFGLEYEEKNSNSKNRFIIKENKDERKRK